MSRVAIDMGSGWARALIDGEKWIDTQYTLHAPTPKRYLSTSVFVSRTAAVEREDGTDDARVPHCEGECRACHGGDGRRALDNAESSRHCVHSMQTRSMHRVDNETHRQTHCDVDWLAKSLPSAEGVKYAG
jgi:hypothetical protein